MNFLQKYITNIILNKIFHISVEKDNIQINCNVPLIINFNKGLSIIIENQEFNLISINHPINIDTINSKLYLNSKKFQENKSCQELSD